MKKEIVIGFGLFILVSCGGNQNENSDNLILEDSTQTVDPIVSSQFNIHDFPTQWYMLHPTGESSAYVMQQWCDAAMQQITIGVTENNLRSFTFNFGQEQLTWKMLNFEAISFVDDSLNYVEGSFSLRPIEDATVTADAVEFYWNRAEKWCNFKGEIIGDNRFVNEEEKGSYILVEEDCSDFWEE
jgi:hypothetical protein